MAHNYVLQVSAGSEYDIKTHKIVPVNQSTPITIDSEHINVDLNVRIQVHIHTGTSNNEYPMRCHKTLNCHIVLIQHLMIFDP